jgi:hypothetical protein
MAGSFCREHMLEVKENVERLLDVLNAADLIAVSAQDQNITEAKALAGAYYSGSALVDRIKDSLERLDTCLERLEKKAGYSIEHPEKAEPAAVEAA